MSKRKNPHAAAARENGKKGGRPKLPRCAGCGRRFKVGDKFVGIADVTNFSADYEPPTYHPQCVPERKCGRPKQEQPLHA